MNDNRKKGELHNQPSFAKDKMFVQRDDLKRQEREFDICQVKIKPFAMWALKVVMECGNLLKQILSA